MLLLRLATSKQAQDAPTLISSSPVADVKPRVKTLQSQPSGALHGPKSRPQQQAVTPLSGGGNHQTEGGAASSNDDDATNDQQQQQHGDSNTQAGCTNVAAARLLDLGKKLIEATREGRLEQVRTLVESSGAPFTSDWLGTTALHVAAQSGYADIAEILVRGGVNRDARTKLERTALHLAAQSGSFDIVDLLVNHGSDVNARDMLRMTPLHWAVERNHVMVAERLLVAGADVELSNKFLLTALDIARESGSYEMIELFKNWTSVNKGSQNRLAVYAKSPGAILNDIASGNSGGNGGGGGGCIGGSDEILDFDYRLAFVDGPATAAVASTTNGRQTNPMLDNEESCMDLVGLEWNKCDVFDPSLLLPMTDGGGDDEPKVEYLMKVVEELQKENQQLRQKVDQLSTVDP